MRFSRKYQASGDIVYFLQNLHVAQNLHRRFVEVETKLVVRLRFLHDKRKYHINYGVMVSEATGVRIPVWVNSLLDFLK